MVMSQLKVLFLAHSYIRYRGDLAGPFIHNVAKNLVRTGERAYVLAPHNKGLATCERIDGVEIHRFRYARVSSERLAYKGNMDEQVKGKGNWRNKRLFASFLYYFFTNSLALVRSRKIDILFAHWWIPGGLVGWLASLLTGKPLLVTLHGTDYRVLKKYRYLRPLAKLIFKRARYVTVVSSFMKEYLVESDLVSKDKIEILPMPVDSQRFKPQKLLKKDKKIILCVAKFTKQKGLDYLIEASKLLFDKKLDFEVKIIGGGPDWGHFEKKIKDLGLSQMVFLFDKILQEKLPSYYQEADVIVLPAIEEGFGLVLVEAQLCRRPVIGTKSGGIPDIIEDEMTGLLIPPKDHFSLAFAMERILTDEKLAGNLAEAGYRSALGKFSPEVIQGKYQQILSPLSPDLPLADP